MNLDSIIIKRKSTRSFKKRKPNWRDIIDAINSSLQGPFAGNHNNLKFIIIEDTTEIKKIAKAAEQTWITESKIIIVVCSNDTYLEEFYGKRGIIYSKQQSGAAIQTILLKLTEKGLSSCWVGSYSDKTIKNQLKIPKKIEIEAVIPVGYSESNEKLKPTKKELENVIYWDIWDQEKRPTIIKEKKDPLALN